MTDRLALAVGLAVIGITVATSVSAQSLAEVARREKARRAAIADEDRAKVYTNRDLRGAGRLTTGSSRPAPPVPAAAPGGGGGETETAAESEPGAATGAADEGARRDEAYWRDRITEAREAHERAGLIGAALQNRVDGLWAQFTAVDDPARRAVVAQQRVEALTELEAVETEQERLDQEIRDIKEEARRSNVPPGWLR